jgi:penicillin-binding protein 1C
VNTKDILAWIRQAAGGLSKRQRQALGSVLLVAVVLIGFRLWPHPHLQDWKPSSVAFYDDHDRLLRLTLASDERYRRGCKKRFCSTRIAGSTGTPA